MNVSDNQANIDGKALHTLAFDLESCAYVRLMDQQVPHNEEMVPIVYGVLESSIKNERNVHKSRRLTTTATLQVAVIDQTLGTAWGELQRFAVSWATIKVMFATSSVPVPSPPTPDSGPDSVPSLTAFATNTEHNPANFKQEQAEVSEWQTLTTKGWDDELGIQYELVEKVVMPNAPLPVSAQTTWVEQQRQVDKYRAIQSFYQLADPYDLTRTETIQFTFPALLAYWDGDPAVTPILPDWTLGAGWVETWTEEATGRTVFMINVHTREAFTALVYSKVREQVITEAEFFVLVGAVDNPAPWGTGPDLGTDVLRANLYNPRPRDISYNGLMFNLQIPNVLCDADTLTATSNSEDTYYGAVTEIMSYPSSYPTCMGYIGLIGQTVCVEDSFTQWKHGLYKRRRVFIKLQ